MLWVLLPFLIKCKPGRGFEKLAVSLHLQNKNHQPPTLVNWNHPIACESPKLPIGRICTVTMSAVPEVMEGSGETIIPRLQSHPHPPINTSEFCNIFKTHHHTSP